MLAIFCIGRGGIVWYKKQVFDEEEMIKKITENMTLYLAISIVFSLFVGITFVIFHQRTKLVAWMSIAFIFGVPILWLGFWHFHRKTDVNKKARL
jgi:alpha-L-arabinofuranosidase